MKRVTSVCFLLCLTAGLLAAATASSSQKLPDLSSTQDVNGFMPSRVWIRTMTQTYCKGFSFVVVDGRIYVKRDKDKEWTLFLKKGLPYSKDSKKAHSYFETPAAVREICADDDSLFAIDDNGVQYNCYINFGTDQKLFQWRKIFGWPKSTPLVQNDLVKGKRGWSMGVRRQNILWYTDRFGNEHHYGTMGLETVYYLTEDGRHIRFTDSGLPTDFSHSIQCPVDGTFISENISVSGSTIFLIGNDGTMFTRLIDFDTMGCDPMFFKYTYDFTRQNMKGSDYRSNFTTWGLPAEDWFPQPKIPLTGEARLTKMVSIAQTGQGNSARELRVAGTDASGKVGYYHKMLDDKLWIFTEAPLDLSEENFLDSDKPVIDENDNNTYHGYLTKNGTTLDGYTCLVSDMPLTSEGECLLTIIHGKEHVNIRLYTVEMWTFMTRNNPGYDGTAKNYFVTPEFSVEEFTSLSSDFKSLLTDMFEGKYHKLFAFSAEATVNYFQMQCSGKDMRTMKDPLAKSNEYLIFTAKQDVQNMHPEAYKGALVLFQPLLQKADSSDLSLQSGCMYTIRERSRIEEKITANKEYKKQLENELSTYRENEKKTDFSRWGYNAIDLITTITFLNKIDFPKIKTVTQFGGELMNTNAESFASIASYNEWCYSHILELVDLRITSFTELIKQFDNNKISARLNPRLCDTFPEYFKLVNLPERADGSTNEHKSHLEEITFIPYFPGYLLQLEDGSENTILVELHDSAKKIFSRAEDVTLKDKPFEVPVTFETVTVLSQSNSVEEKKVTAGISDLSKKEGTLTWDGEKITITVTTSVFTKAKLFEGK